MFNITGDAVGEVWMKYLSCVLQNGAIYHDEDTEILELEDIVLTIKNNIVDDPILRKYADENLAQLYLKKMQTQEVVPELNASYGQRIFNQLGVNQYEWCLNRLQRKPETKAATMSLLLPDDPGPRIPCLDIIDIKLRGQELSFKTFFRSQNALNAYGNILALFWLMDRFSQDLHVSRGKLICFISNGHIYSEKVNIAEKIVEDYFHTRP